jgi:hypothetical protein
VDQDGHGQHDHGKILINDAAKQQNPASCVSFFQNNNNRPWVLVCANFIFSNSLAMSMVMAMRGFMCV